MRAVRQTAVKATRSFGQQSFRRQPFNSSLVRNFSQQHNYNGSRKMYGYGISAAAAVSTLYYMTAGDKEELHAEDKSVFAHPDICGSFGPEMDRTVRLISKPGKGILAADECPETTMGERLSRINLPNTLENRQAYKEVIFTSGKEFSDYVSGVILYEETLYQKTSNGVDFVKVLNDNGIVVGITLDRGQEDGGMKEIVGTHGDIRIQGSDDIDLRIKKYYQQGARFGKWRAVVKLTDVNPSQLAIDQTAKDLARYAAICQANGLVPIVEPEVLVMDGSHDINKSYAVTEKVLSTVFKELVDHGVVLERIILKPNMVLPGNDSPKKASSQEVAEYTLKVLQRTVPPAVPIIAFLSGGQTEEEAADHLNRINKISGPKPWSISFSYGRALQQSALRAWKGDATNSKEAQQSFLRTCKQAFLAAQGKL